MTLTSDEDCFKLDVILGGFSRSMNERLKLIKILFLVRTTLSSAWLSCFISEGFWVQIFTQRLAVLIAVLRGLFQSFQSKRRGFVSN